MAPHRSPKGYHTAARGQSQTTDALVASRAAPGCRVVGLRQIDGMPHEPQCARSSAILPRGHGAPAVLSACCKEGSVAVSYGAPRCRPGAGQWVSPGAVERFSSSRRGFDSRHPIHNKRPGQAILAGTRAWALPRGLAVLREAHVRCRLGRRCGRTRCQGRTRSRGWW